MGVFFRLIEPEHSPVLVEVPGVFRFEDINPITGTPYVECEYPELPDFAAWVVRERLHLEPGAWSLEVADGTAWEWFTPGEGFALDGWVRA